MRTRSLTGGVSAVESTALSLLFTRFVSGEISDVAWSQMMSILDESVTSGEERAALVSFLNDACGALGAEAVKVPEPAEMEDFVSILRAA